MAQGKYAIADATPIGQYRVDDVKPQIDSAQQAPERSGTSSALTLAATEKAVDGARRATSAALAHPNAPRIIQRAIGAGVRGASTAVGAHIGGVPGAVGGAAMSEGFTPTQQTIRGWIGRPTPNMTSAASAGDAVTNYIESMGANPNNLTGAALEYAKKSGRSVLYDASGTARLVPAEAVAQTVAQPVKATSGFFRGKVAPALSKLNVVQGALDLTQMGEPERKDIGFLGIGQSQDANDIPSRKPEQFPASMALNNALAVVAERMGRPDLAAKYRAGYNPDSTRKGQ